MKLKQTLLGIILQLGFACGVTVAAEMKIGVAEALTGNAAQYGVPIRKGFELAVGELNGSGGINGNKIELVIEDEQGKKEEAINVFKKLIFQDKVLMLFGPTLSNSAQASDPVAQAGKVVVFGTSNTADGITSIGNYVFRNSVTEADILPVTLKVAAQKTGLKKVAVLYGNDDIFTKSGYDNFVKALQALKIPVATAETFAKGDVDFKPQLTKIKASNPDAIVLSALVAEGGPIMVQARQLAITLPFIGGNGMNSPRVFELAKDTSDNLWVGSPWSVENPATENKRLSPPIKKPTVRCRINLRLKLTTRSISSPRHLRKLSRRASSMPTVRLCETRYLGRSGPARRAPSSSDKSPLVTASPPATMPCKPLSS